MDSSHENASSTLPNPSLDNQQEESDSKEMQCPICQEKTAKTCSACKKVAYCCVEHQRLDWKNHKQVCQPFSIENIDGMGKGWVANRDLPAGFLLLKETPVIQAPWWKFEELPDFTAESWVQYSSSGLRECLICGVLTKGRRICSLCSWPICSNKCEKNRLHVENECKEFVSREWTYPLLDGDQIGLLTTCIRANGLKIRDPSKFNQLMALQDFCPFPPANQKLQDPEIPDEVFQLNGPNCLAVDEYRKLLRICKVNGLATKSARAVFNFGYEYGSKAGMMVVYLKVSRLNHSCSPNCTAIISPAPSHKIKIFTSVPVTKGDQLFINYHDMFSTQTTSVRQKIMKDCGFICKCNRCLDPTEFGTFVSGIKCFNCSSDLKADSESDDVGFLVDEHPLDYDSMDRKLECQRCHVKLYYAEIIMTKLPKTVERAFFNIEQWIKAAPGSISALENLLKEYENHRDFKDHLHPNHWIIQTAMRVVITLQIKAMEMEMMTEEDLKRRFRRLKFLLKIDDQLCPGLSRYRYEDLLMLKNTLVYLLSVKSGLSSEDYEEFYPKLLRAEREVGKFEGLIDEDDF